MFTYKFWVKSESKILTQQLVTHLNLLASNITQQWVSHIHKYGTSYLQALCSINVDGNKMWVAFAAILGYSWENSKCSIQNIYCGKYPLVIVLLRDMDLA